MQKYLRLVGPLLILWFSTAFAQITLWTTENQPDRMEIQSQIAAACETTTGVSTTLVPVVEEAMGERVTAAYAAGELPDVIFHPPYYTLGWAEEGVLDPFAATDVVNNLSLETFNEGALEYVEFDGDFAAVPTSTFPLLLLYREDLFTAAGLEPLTTSTTFEDIRAAIEALHNPPEMYGIAVGTDPSAVIMAQHLEALFTANGVNLFDENGEIDINNEEAIEVLNFYKTLVEAGPPGNLDNDTIRDLYLSGKVAMTFWSSYILDELAGLRDDVPVTAYANSDPSTPELARNTGILATFSGPNTSGATGWAEVYYFGITVDADIEAAQQFVECVMNEHYLEWLSMAPEGSFPVRTGTPEEPNSFVEGWSSLNVGVDRKAPLSQFYSEETVNEITSGLENSERWAYAEGQGALVSRILGTRAMTEVVREFLAGEYTAEETAELMQQRFEDLQ